MPLHLPSKQIYPLIQRPFASDINGDEKLDGRYYIDGDRVYAWTLEILASGFVDMCNLGVFTNDIDFGRMLYVNNYTTGEAA